VTDLTPPRPLDPALSQLLADFPTKTNPDAQVEMDEEEATRVLQLAEIASIPIVVDGGWAVDALLGWQTRPHSDLDLAINQQYLPRFLNILRRLDYQYLPTNDEWEHNFVLENCAGHRVDIHSFIRNNKGQIVGGVEYPGESLNGQGRIAGVNVACIHPEWLVDFHLGYEFDHQDYQDVNYLCNLFKLPLPPEYQDYANSLYAGHQAEFAQLSSRVTTRLPCSLRDYLDLANLLDKTDNDKLSSETQLIFGQLLENQTEAESALLSDFQQAGLRVGLLLLEERKPIGACELVCASKQEDASQNGQTASFWSIKQLSLAKYWNYSSLFMLLLRASIEAALKSGATRVEVLPLDDITQPRPALPDRYDMAEIGFASFYARAGFRREEPNPSSRFFLDKK